MKKISGFVIALFLFTACTARPTPMVLPTEITPAAFTEVVTVEPLPTSDNIIPINPGDAMTPMPEGSYNPQPSDANLTRGAVFVEEYGVLTLESFPLQFVLSLSGNLPDPCHQLRAVIAPPDSENKINIEVYTVVDPNMMCIQVIKPFQLNLPLGSFPTGHYTVWLNGEMIAEFDA